MDFLKDVLGEELFKQISEKLKGNDKVKLGNIASGEYVSKLKYDDLDKRLSETKAQITERDKQLETLKTQAAGSEALQAEIKKLQDGNTLAEKEYQAKLSAQERDYALREALKNSHKAHDALSVIPHLKQDTIIFKDGAFTGLDEQVKGLKESKPFLFESEPAAKPGTGGTPGTPPGVNGGVTGGVTEGMKLSDAVAQYYK